MADRAKGRPKQMFAAGTLVRRPFKREPNEDFAANLVANELKLPSERQ
jgi:hypothetical protein